MGITYRDNDLQIRLDPLNGGLLFSALRRYYSWQTSEEVTRYNSHGLFPKSKKDLDIWISSVERGKDNVTFAIFYQDEWVGVCSLQSINFINRSGEVAIYIGEPSAWGKGLATSAVSFLLWHGFMRLGLNRIWSGTAEENIGMNKVFKKLGFTKEGIFREGMFVDGDFMNINCWSVLKAEYDKMGGLDAE